MLWVLIPFIILGLLLSQRRACRVCERCGSYVDTAERPDFS